MKTFSQRTFRLVVAISFLMVGNVFLLPRAVEAKSQRHSQYQIERHVIKTHVFADGSDVETREVTTLVRTEAAIDVYSQADIAFNSTFQTVDVLEAYTLTGTGKKTPVATNAIRLVDDDISGSTQHFSDQKHRIIIFPNVTPGARVTYKVKVTTHTPIFAKNYQNGIYVAPGSEIKNFEWHFSHDPRIVIQVDAKRISGGRQANGPKGEIQYKYQFHQSKTRPQDSAEVDYEDYSPHVVFSSFSSPIEIGKFYEKSLQSKLKVTHKVKDLAQKITKDIKDPKAQTIALYQWVSLNIRYVAIFLGDGGIVPNDPDTILDRRYGDCKDHDVLFRTLLLAKGIPSSSALINAGDSYQVHRLGTITPFNHVITYLPEWDHYVDSTLQVAPYGFLDFSEMDKPVVLTALGKMGRTGKLSDENNGFISKAHFKVDERGGISGTSKTMYLGPKEVAARLQYDGFIYNNDNSLEKKYLAAYRQTGVGAFYPSNTRDLNEPFALQSKFYLDPIVNIPGPGAMTIPIGLSSGYLADIPFNEQPDTYHFPYRCLSGTFLELSEIEFPKSVKNIKVPPKTEYSEYGALYVSTYTLENNVVLVSRILKLNRESSVCPAGANTRGKRIRQVVRKDMLAQILYE